MRIIVVEDEDRIREGIVELISKMNPDYKVIGEAENGLIGLEVISSCKPDLVIVDIKMPVMDGIEMLMLLKERGIKHKTIILSGYSDFEYAQKAIKIGVSEYLLKPITAKDLEQTLKNVKKEINMSKILEVKQPQVLNSIENIFQNLILRDLNDTDKMYKYLKEVYGINPEGIFILVNIYLGVEFNTLKHKTEQVIRPLLDRYKGTNYCIFELPLHFELIILIFDFKEKNSLERFFQNIIIRELHRENIKGIACGWICFSTLKDINNSLKILRKELKWSIVLGEDVLISYPKNRQINTKLIQYPIDIETNAKAAVCCFDTDKLDKLFRRFLSWWGKEIYEPSGVIEAFIRFASSIINVVKEIDYELYEGISQKETLQGLMDSVTWNELENALMSIVEKILLYKKKGKHIVSLVIKKTLSLIDEFYMNGITLDEIASRMNITPEYLGSLFYKETGVNFSVYIKEFRIKKAKELLIGTEFKIYEIAEKVGYQDPKYFSRVFKEVTGMTPGEYQKTNK